MLSESNESKAINFYDICHEMGNWIWYVYVCCMGHGTDIFIGMYRICLYLLNYNSQNLLAKLGLAACSKRILNIFWQNWALLYAASKFSESFGEIGPCCMLQENSQYLLAKLGLAARCKRILNIFWQNWD